MQEIKSFEIVTAEISFLAHATEDKELMISQIASALMVDREKFESVGLVGHWGNQIDMVKARFEEKSAQELAMLVLSSLSPYDCTSLLKSLGDYTDDKGSLHLRVDKQRICAGKIELSGIDAIKIRFIPRPFFSKEKEDYIREYRRLLVSND